MRASGVRRPLREFRIAGSPLKQRDKLDFPARPHCERAKKRRQEGTIGPARRATPTAPATFRPPPTFGTFRPSQESAKRTSDPRAGIRLRISPHDSGNVFSGEKERRIVMPGATKRCTAIDRSGSPPRSHRASAAQPGACRRRCASHFPAPAEPVRAKRGPQPDKNAAPRISFARPSGTQPAAQRKRCLSFVVFKKKSLTLHSIPVFAAPQRQTPAIAPCQRTSRIPNPIPRLADCGGNTTTPNPPTFIKIDRTCY